jgi:hypothetical protein
MSRSRDYTMPPTSPDNITILNTAVPTSFNRTKSAAGGTNRKDRSLTKSPPSKRYAVSGDTNNEYDSF